MLLQMQIDLFHFIDPIILNEVIHHNSLGDSVIWIWLDYQFFHIENWCASLFYPAALLLQLLWEVPLKTQKQSIQISV